MTKSFLFRISPGTKGKRDGSPWTVLRSHVLALGGTYCHLWKLAMAWLLDL